MRKFNAFQTNSPVKKILAVVVIAFVLQTAYFSYHYSDSFSKEAQKFSIEKLNGVVNSAAKQINGDTHQALMSQFPQKDAILKTEQDANYHNIHRILNANYYAHGLKSPIYTLVLNPQNNHFEFGVTSSENPYFRHIYTHFPKELIEKMWTGGTIPLYKDEFGSWLTAFAPIKNQQGEVVALLMADEKFDDVYAYIQAVNFKNIGVSIAIVVVLIGALLFWLRGVIVKEQKIKKVIERAYNDKAQLNEKLAEGEEKLKIYAQKLEQSNKELTDFAHVASHDLKAPVRGIASFTQLLARRNKDKFDERDLEYLNFIQKNAQQSLALIDNLLDFSKIDKNIGKPLPINVKEIIDVACNNLKSIIDERGVVVRIHEMPIIKAHSGLLVPLFQNLINNGIKYNENALPTIEINAELGEDKTIIFSVKDNGIGIAEAYQTSIFNMFSRLHSAAQYEGSGIGLAFCKRIIDTYEGRIWVESTIGEGSIFYFTLPNAEIISMPQTQKVPQHA